MSEDQRYTGQGLDAIGVLLRQVGELNGKADGILRELQDIKDDNIRCHADRENIYGEVNKLANKQYWMAGAAAGAGVFITAILHNLGIPLFGAHSQ